MGKWKTYYCTDHDQFNPVGSASIVSSTDKRTAVKKLKKALKERGLDSEKPFTLKRLKVDETVILIDGNY